MVVGVTVALASCTDATTIASPAPTRTFDDVTAEEWAALGSTRVFFGHQSVGRNIMEGMKEVLAAESHIPLNLVTTDTPSSVGGAAFIESSIGTNGDPLGKTAAFTRSLESGLGGERSIALHKYCYVDVQADTDVDVLFAEYKRAMQELVSRHPNTTFVHVTMPLTSLPDSRAKAFVKQLLGRGPDASDLNVKRNRFNRLLTAEYAGRAPIFDLARLESTRENGERTHFRLGQDTVYTMAQEWTYDGGHLNEEGRRRAARALLTFLATLPADS